MGQRQEQKRGRLTPNDQPYTEYKGAGREINHSRRLTENIRASVPKLR